MPKDYPNKLKTIDLFAGCGGLTDGFEQTGFFKTLAAVEWEKPALETLTNRLKEKWGITTPNFHPIYFDMQRTEELLHGWENDNTYGSFEGLANVVQEDVDVIVGGPPCQAYSIAGRIRDANGMKDDYRNFLFETYIQVVNQFRPKAFIFENVFGMLSANPAGIPIPQLIREGFDRIGYEIVGDIKKYAELDAQDYGVPQSRKRLIILGLDKKLYKDKTQEMLLDFYTELLPSYKSSNTKTVKEAIDDLPKIIPLKDSPSKASHKVENVSKEIQNHVPRYHNNRDIEIFKELATDILKGTNLYTTIDALKKLYEEKTGKKSNIHKYNVLKQDQPSNTIVAHLHKDGLRHIHYDPNQARSITVREAARLQTFDDDFVFLGGQGDQYKMIGNAVPPRLANIIANSLHKLLQKYEDTAIIKSDVYEDVNVSRTSIRP